MDSVEHSSDSLPERQVGPVSDAVETDNQSADQVDAQVEKYNRQSAVIKAALRLAYADWDNGGRTASDSHDLDFAHDLLDEALDAYVAQVAPAASIRMPAGCTFTYNVPDETWYAEHLGDSDRAEVMVCASHEGGGVAWEFGIRAHAFSAGGSSTHIRAEVFGDAFDAFAAFTDIRPFFDALAKEKPSSLAAVRALLDRLGAVDVTNRERPGDLA